MRIYQVWGDLSADRQDDIYPMVPICDDCALELEDLEDAIVQEISDFDEIYGEECYYCGKSKQEEDGELYYLDAIRSNVDFFATFQSEISKIRALNDMQMQQNDKHLGSTLRKQLYIGVITCLEAYLSDAFINTVLSDEYYLSKFAEEFKPLKDKKLNLNQLFRLSTKIKNKENRSDFDVTSFVLFQEIAKEEILKVIYHNIPKVKVMYQKAFDISFPDFVDISRAVNTRHDLVHRNGKTKDGREIAIDNTDVTELSDTVEAFVRQIDNELNLLNNSA